MGRLQAVHGEEMIVRQHIPAFVDTDPQPDAHAATLLGLLAVPFVARWNDQQLNRFEVAWEKERPLLMARMKSGEFWVVAHLYPEGDADMLNALPEWTYTDADRARHKG